MQEYEEAAMAFRRHESEQTKVTCCPFKLLLQVSNFFPLPCMTCKLPCRRTNAQPPEYVDSPTIPPMPRMPSKQEFLAHLTIGTLVSTLPYYSVTSYCFLAYRYLYLPYFAQTCRDRRLIPTVPLVVLLPRPTSRPLSLHYT